MRSLVVVLTFAAAGLGTVSAQDPDTTRPHAQELRQRIVDLKHSIDEDEARARENAFTADMPFGEEFAEAVNDMAGAGANTLADSGEKGAAVAVLQGWLDTIGRMKQCRSVKR